jgi:hypothetical protein
MGFTTKTKHSPPRNHKTPQNANPLVIRHGVWNVGGETGVCGNMG